MKFQSTGDYGVQPFIVENDEQLTELFELMQEIQERAAEIGNAMLKLEGKKESIDSSNIHFNDGDITAEYETYHGCGNYETEYLSIPTKYLFDENFLTEAKEKLRVRKEREERDRYLAEEKRKRDAEERERKKYLELKARFEGGVK
jgi:hypothetical protein